MISKGWSKKKYVLIYTLVFCIFSAGVFAPFLIEHKSFVWNQDGGPQYLPNLAYVGRYLRDTARRALQGDVSLKMYDFTIGYGSDVYAAVKTRPLELLSAIVPVRYTEILYNILVLLRLYLGGLSFTLFCSLWKELSVTLVTGSMIYIFCGYTLYFAIRHPIFGFPLILLPLILYGAERMIRGQGRRYYAPLALSVFLGFFVNYYFCYMCTAALAVYVLARLPWVYRQFKSVAMQEGAAGRGVKGPGRRTFGVLVRIALIYLLGTAMAMVVLWPIVKELGSSARIAQEEAPQLRELLHYDWKRYYRWLLYLCAPWKDAGSGTMLNYCALAVPALCLVIFTDARKHKGALAAFLVSLLILFIPFGGYAMSGFSSVTNRWIFIFSMVIACFYVMGEDLFFAINRKRRITLAIITGLYLALALYEYHVSADRKVIAGAILLLAADLSILLANLICRKARNAKVRNLKVQNGRTSENGSRIPAGARWFLLGAAFVLCFLDGWLSFSPSHTAVLTEYLDQGTGITTITQSAFARAQAIDDDSFWRVDSNLITSNKENYSVILGYRGTSIYNSVLNGPLTYLMLDLEENGIPSVHRLQGLDSRTAIEELSNVKYYLTTSDGDSHVPYGFTKRLDLTDTDIAVFENQNPLAFGYTYDTCISREDYEKLSAVEKQQVMLHAAVTDEVPEGMKTISQAPEQIDVVSVNLPKTEKTDGLKRTKKGYKAGSDGGSFTIPVERREGCECYVRFTGVDTNKTYAFIDLTTSAGYTQMQVRGHGKMYSLNRSEYIVSLGYAQQTDTLTVHFPAGRYSLSGIELIYIPMDGYEEAVAALNEESLENVTFATNRISGTVSLSGAKVMVLSIPYSEGWSAAVDGEKQTLLQADDGYTGLYLEEGEHSIVLTYWRPGLKAGAVVSVIGWALFLWRGRRRRRTGHLAPEGV